MNYNQAIEYLNSFQNLEQKTFYDYSKVCRLERVSKLCDIIGRPQDDFKSVLVSGTNGKGSACAILHSALVRAGYRVGLYTSPHLLDLRERIKLNNKAIRKGEFAELIEEVKESIKYAKAEDLPIYEKLTFFEILTAVCFLYFSKKRVDLAIIEAGLGGRLDATNLTYPLVSVITSIGCDHTHLLGKSLARIAKEKAGIIKENIFTISAPQKREAMGVIKAIARKSGSKLFTVGEDIRYKCSKVNFYQTIFNYQGKYKSYKNIELPLAGEHQAQNGAVSLAALEILKRHFYFHIDESCIREGFKGVNWPGRFDILRKKPYIIADGAHNKDSARILKRILAQLIGKEKIDYLILGFSSDKDIKGIGSILCPLAKNVIFTKSYSPRAIGPISLSNLLSKNCSNSFIARKPESALSTARRSTPKNGIILITGSLFLVSDIVRILR